MLSENTKVNFLNYLNSLEYPICLISQKKVIWANNAFVLLHKNNVMSEDEMYEHIYPSLKTLSYSVNNGSKNLFFEPSQSKIIIENENYQIVNFFNISKRKKILSKFNMEQKMFQELCEQLPEGVVLYEHNILYTNPAFEKLVKHTGSSLKDMLFISLFDESSQKILHNDLFKLQQRPTLTIESKCTIVNNGGKSILVSVKSKIIIQDNKQRFLHIVNNISKEYLEFEKLNKLANYDKLTSIYNRRMFDEILLVEYKRSKRYERELSGIFFDIDHFKKINDNFGHDIGDKVLIELCSILKNEIRETDIFARWGGEEFILILPEITKEKAFSIANTLREFVEQHAFKKVSQVTISIGVTALRKNERLTTFLKRLDQALYKAKTQGRNCSVIL